MEVFKYLILFSTLTLLDGKMFARNHCPDFNVSPTFGVFTLPGEFPYMFAIGWKSDKHDEQYIYKCAGVMFSNEYVLTAAHCLYDSDDLPVVVRAGGDGLRNTEVIIEIIDIIEHPEYAYPSTYNDIALLRLAPNDRFQFALLPDGNVFSHENVTAIGYGKSEFAGAPTEKLVKVNLSVTSQRECRKYYAANASSLYNGIVETQFCACDPKMLDTCQGDTGGPLVRIELGKHFIVGISSFGVHCGKRPPGVYTNVNKYLGWIESVTRPWYNEEFPYMYGLHWMNHTTCLMMRETCGAVQIRWNYLLISAHCLHEFDELPLFFRQGGHNWKQHTIEVQYTDIIVHPDYKHPAPYNDIALVKITFQPYCVTPIWLKDRLESKTLTYVNYAESNKDQFKRQDMLKTTLTYVSNNLCAHIYKDDYFAGNFSHGIVSSHLCANDTQQQWDLGQGYADGPLIMHADVDGVQVPYVVGIASFGVNCEGCPPAVFTRISKYIDWIEEVVGPKEDTNPTIY